MPPSRPRSSLCATLLALCAAVSAAELHLDDGRILDGEATRVGDTYQVVITNGSLRATTTVPVDQVVRFLPGKSKAQEQRERLLTARKELSADASRASSADAWFALAQQAKTAGDQALMREFAQEAIEYDRHHAESRALLGFVASNGIWMRPNEANTARGLVFFEGRWVTTVERDLLVAARAEAQAREQAEAIARHQEVVRRAAAQAAAQAATEDASRTTVTGTIFRNPHAPNSYVVPYPTIYAAYPEQWYWGRPAYCPPRAHSQVRLGGAFANGGWSFAWNW